MKRLSKATTVAMLLVTALWSTPARADDDNAVTTAGIVLTILGAAGGAGAIGCAESFLPRDSKDTCIGVTAGTGAFLLILGIGGIVIGTKGLSIFHGYYRDPNALRGVALTVEPRAAPLTWGDPDVLRDVGPRAAPLAWAVRW